MDIQSTVGVSSPENGPSQKEPQEPTEIHSSFNSITKKRSSKQHDKDEIQELSPKDFGTTKFPNYPSKTEIEVNEKYFG